MTTINPPIVASIAGSVTQPTSFASSWFGHGASEDAVDFWALWDECKQDLLSHHCLRWMGGNHADAEDALSEACLRAWQAWSAKTPELTNIQGWFVRVVQNHCHNVRKAHTRQTRVVQCVEDIATMAGDQAAKDELAAPEDAALRRELGQYIRRAIDDLPPPAYRSRPRSTSSRMSLTRTLPLA